MEREIKWAVRLVLIMVVGISLGCIIYFSVVAIAGDDVTVTVTTQKEKYVFEMASINATRETENGVVFTLPNGENVILDFSTCTVNNRKMEVVMGDIDEIPALKEYLVR